LELSFIWATGTVGQVRKIFHANSIQKKRMPILISDKIDFKCKKLTRDKEGHNILIKGSIWQEDLTVKSIYALNDRSSKYIKQKRTFKYRERTGGCQRVWVGEWVK